MNTVITISRQYGSGGRFVGRLLADSLGIPFYDKEIIAMASENSGFAQDFIKENEQKMKGLSSVSFTPSVWGGTLINSFENFESRIYASETPCEVFYCRISRLYDSCRFVWRTDTALP